MLTLILFRHAKSAWDDPDLEDFDRGLAPRGTKAAPRMAQWIASEGLSPQVVLCSSAVRTRATLTLAVPHVISPPIDIRYEDGLYLATAATIITHLKRLDDAPSPVMVVGHNPGMHAAALELTGAGRKRDITQLAMQFPTAAAAVITFDLHAWRDIGPGAGRLVTFQTPRRLD